MSDWSEKQTDDGQYKSIVLNDRAVREGGEKNNNSDCLAQQNILAILRAEKNKTKKGKRLTTLGGCHPE